MMMSAAKRGPRKTTPKPTVKEPAARPSPPPELPDEDSSLALPADKLAPGFPIVGIGASAGGLDAFKRLFSTMPSDTGAAFVLIPHLDPQHESLMVELLARYTKMPVVEAADAMPVEANHLYVIPPNKYMTISGGLLHLTGPVEHGGLQTSIDLFLRALANDQQEKAICIILSGTGSHGTMGLKEVKAMGGMAMVQDPLTAEYPSMPQSAIATGLADHVLSVEQMSAALVKYLQHFYVKGDRVVAESDKDADDLNQVLVLLRARTKFDFRCYRKKMLTRRVERRMGLNHFERLTQYVASLREHPDEIKQLVRDLLISVTSFFRDPEAFRSLQTEVIARLVAAADTAAVLRVWVPGCATGEEPYSIAMLFIERLAAAQKNCRLQIFATDADEEALEVARRGVYPESISADVSPERLERFFTRVDESTYQVNKLVRETVVFAAQNLISDAPFSRMDLISCRNILIYLEPEVQKKVITLLHFALNEGGYLFLGPSETIGRQTDIFEPNSKKWRIYRRIGPTRPDRVEFPISGGVESLGRVRRPLDATQTRPLSFAELTHRLLLNELAPTAVLINRKCEVLYFLGPTTRYLDVPTGEPTVDLTMMAREGLRTKLRGAIHKAIDSGRTIHLDDVQLKRNGAYVPITVTITPVQSPKMAEGLLLVRFEDVTEREPRAAVRLLPSEDSLVRQLEYELRAAKEDLQGTIEAMKSSHEELKASNEEIMSMNEELQLANEELETSKEEMQSLNEELATVNSQLQERVHELEETNNDLANLLASTEMATVFLDAQFRIKRFTSSAAELLNLMAADVGRPLSDISLKFTDKSLLRDAEHVLKNLTPAESEVKADDGRWYIRRILPYRTLDSRIEGVVVTLTNVTQIKEAEARIRELNEQLKQRIVKRTAQLKDSDRKLQENIEEVERLTVDQRDQLARMDAMVRTATDAIVTIDERGIIETFNPAAERIFGYTAAEAIGRNVSLLMPSPYAQEHDNYIARYLATGVARILGISREVLGRRKDGTTFPMDLAVSEVRDARRLFTGFIRDASERKAKEREVLDAVTTEQRRIGQDLHDDLGQKLTALGLMSRSLVESLTDKSLPEAPIATRVAEGISESLGKIRVLSRGLVPVEFGSEGLASALQILADQTNLLHDVVCDVQCAKSLPEFDNTTATHLYRIAQEAVTNAVRHGQPSNIHIHMRLAADDSQIVLSVADDGIGLQQPPDETAGMGLRIMAYRAQLIGATLTVEPGEDGGTIVTCRLPKGP